MTNNGWLAACPASADLLSVCLWGLPPSIPFPRPAGVLAGQPATRVVVGGGAADEAAAEREVSELLAEFRAVQERHARARQADAHRRSLLHHPKATSSSTAIATDPHRGARALLPPPAPPQG